MIEFRRLCIGIPDRRAIEFRLLWKGKRVGENGGERNARSGGPEAESF
jgi:hypothetical protein